MVALVELVAIGLNWLGTSQPRGTAQWSIGQPTRSKAIPSSRVVIGCKVCGTTCGSIGWTLILRVPWHISTKNHCKIK